jgi:hypothetical protein
MNEAIETFYRMRLEHCGQALAANNFETYIAENSEHATEIFQQKIFPRLTVKSASWGDSLSLSATAILDFLRSRPEIDFIETFEPGLDRSELIERRRRALLVDLFLTGTNAVTKDGALVNLDMVGNRVGPMIFGPRHVVLVIGRNKIASDVETAMTRIKDHAAPLNAIRHKGLKTPCMKTSFCMDCKSPDRICNSWTIIEKSYPKERIKIILVNDDLGL